MELQIDVSFSRVCPVIDNKFRHNIVKVTVDPLGESRVDPQTTLSITGQTHQKLTTICFYDNKLSNCPISLVYASHKL